MYVVHSFWTFVCHHLFNLRRKNDYYSGISCCCVLIFSEYWQRLLLTHFHSNQNNGSSKTSGLIIWKLFIFSHKNEYIPWRHSHMWFEIAIRPTTTATMYNNKIIAINKSLSKMEINARHISRTNTGCLAHQNIVYGSNAIYIHVGQFSRISIISWPELFLNFASIRASKTINITFAHFSPCVSKNEYCLYSIYEYFTVFFSVLKCIDLNSVCLFAKHSHGHSNYISMQNSGNWEQNERAKARERERGEGTQWLRLLVSCLPLQCQLMIRCHPNPTPFWQRQQHLHDFFCAPNTSN